MGTVKEEVAKNLSFYRKRAKITQKQLAAQLGVRDTSICNWEAARSSPDINTLVEISGILGVTVTELFGTVGAELTNDYTPHEREVIDAYRAQPEMREAVDRLLGIK